MKRFEISYDENNKKINSFFEFPLELDLEEFTQLAQLKKDIESGGFTDPGLREIPKSYFQYKLKGIIVHIGSINSGHYYSFVEDRESKFEEEQWWEFNDELIRKFDLKNLQEEAFGYKEQMYFT